MRRHRSQKRRFIKARKSRINENHAAVRMLQRTGASFFELKDAVSNGLFTRLWAQTHTRTLCSARLNSEEVYFILNKQRGTIITVLTETQAKSQLGEHYAEKMETVRQGGQGQAGKEEEPRG